MRRLGGKIAAAFVVLVLSAATRAQAQTFTILYSFTGGSDGRQPEAGLLLDAAGNLYGTTAGGGSFNGGSDCNVGGCGNGRGACRVCAETAGGGAAAE